MALIGLLPLLVLGGIVWLIVKAFRSDDEADSGVSVRRFFQYGLLLMIVVLVAIGASGLLGRLLATEQVIRDSSSDIAQSISFLLVGVPALYAMVRWTRSSLDGERGSLAWAIYVTAGALTGLITAATGVYEVLEAVVGAEDYNAQALARTIVWGAVWVVHWRLSERSSDLDSLRIHYFAGSFIGLVTLATAAGFLVATVGNQVYEALFDTVLARSESHALARGLIGLVIGAGIWMRYWFTRMLQFDRSTMWHTYVLVVGVVGGLVTFVTGISALLLSVLDWFFGGVSAAAANHFADTPAVVGSAVIGGAVWLYHLAVHAEGGPTERTEPDRAHDHLIAAVGLLAAGGGVATIIVAAIQAVVDQPTVASSGGDRTTLMAAITLLIVGGILWWRSWSTIQRHRSISPEQELASPSRRIYLTALFGIGGLTALISLISLVVTVLEDILEGRFGSSTFFEVRIQFAIVATVGAMAAYHWAVFKEDRADAPDVTPESPVRRVVLVSGDGQRVAEAVQQRTGIKVRIWDRADGDQVTTVEAVVDAIAVGEHPQLLLIATDDGLRSIPYTEA